MSTTTALPKIRRSLSALAILALAAPVVMIAGPAALAAPPAPDGWQTVFADDFDGPAGEGVDGNNWILQQGHGYPGGATNWGTGEIQSMTSDPANVSKDGAGHLAITPQRDGAGNWTSARVESARTDFAAPAGGVMRIEASLKLPDVNEQNGTAYWPAFWALGDNARSNGAANWPSIGELDIMEAINARNSHFGTLHCGVAPGGPCNEFTGIGSGERSCDGCRTSFHTYAVELDRSGAVEQLRWYRDGNQYFTINADQMDAQSWANAVHHGFFVIMNVSIGGGFPGAFGGAVPNDATEPGKPMLVDYVAVYTRG